ncbi:MAG: thioredoxin domain-containing protein [Scytonematopsis contorta HA4267-MV1]|nr:thioredoxin domain-containing protein [Scytonematopsis contorta HA4267-MV1]
MKYDRDPSSLFIPPLTQDHIQGVLSATVVLVMYGDYESSQSADVYRLIKVIQQQLSVSFGENYLCFIFRHFPQIQTHSHAQHAAQAAEAAAAQSQFWQMHEILFARQQELGNGYLIEYANNLKLDISQFLQDMSKQVHVNRINKDIESGLQSGVTATPALFINGIRYSGRWNIRQLMTAIVTDQRGDINAY